MKIKSFLDHLMQETNKLQQEKRDNPMFDMGYQAALDDIVSRMIHTLQIKKELGNDSK